MSSTNFTILIDSREKTPFNFDKYNVETETTELTTGDYSLKGHADDFAVERKSLDDLARYCGAKRDNFNDQVYRGSQLDQFAVVIDGTRADVENERYYSDMHPDSILGTVDAWESGFDVPFYWHEDTFYAENRTYRCLNSWYPNE